MSNGLLGDLKQQVGGLGNQLGQTIANAPKAAVKTVASQVGIEIKDKEKKGEMPKAVHNQKPPEMDAAAKKANEDFIKGLYGASPDQSQKPPQLPNEKPKDKKEQAFIEN